MPLNNKHIIAQRRSKIAELHLKGYPQFKIAELVGCCQSQVSKDLKILSKQWKESAIADIEEKKGKELAKLDLIEKKLWQSWERSCDKIHRQKIKKVKAQENLIEKERELHAIESIGDSRYIAEIIKCIQLRVKILGLEKTESRVNLSFDQMTDSQLDGIITKILSDDTTES